ncbi:serine/threonine protein kinase [Candidatus Poribacteria bacterium]|nr:serine/threonine protein kinase [Candidatus Poribacteria bacterium]
MPSVSDRELLELIVRLGLAEATDVSACEREARDKDSGSIFSILWEEGFITRSQFQIIEEARDGILPFKKAVQALEEECRRRGPARRGELERAPNTYTIKGNRSRRPANQVSTPRRVDPAKLEERHGATPPPVKRAEVPPPLTVPPSQVREVPVVTAPPPVLTPEDQPEEFSSAQALKDDPRKAPPSEAPKGKPKAKKLNPPDLLGKRLGRYMISTLVGRGASGCVFLGHHVFLNMPVAIKVLDPLLAEEHPSVQKRFMHEARSAARIRHPNVVRVHDCDFLDGYQILVMEYVEGKALNDLIAEERFLEEERALRLIYHAAHGLEAALEAGLIHRDVKPANLLIDKGDAVKVIDFGLSKWMEKTGLPSETGPNMMLGTAAYRAPEQTISAKSVDQRADIWALGATLYHMVTGQLPKKGPPIGEYVLGVNPASPALESGEVPAQISPDTAQLILDMMADNPDERVPDYETLGRRLVASVKTLRASKPAE